LRALATTFDIASYSLEPLDGDEPVGTQRRVDKVLEALRASGKIRRWGVSNFDTDDMEELGAEADDCATNQVLYNPEARGIEFDLLPWCQERQMPVMAYSPIGQAGRLLQNKALLEAARRHDATTAQIAGKNAWPRLGRENTPVLRTWGAEVTRPGPLEPLRRGFVNKQVKFSGHRRRGRGPADPLGQTSLLPVVTRALSTLRPLRAGAQRAPASPVCAVARGLRGGSRSGLPRPSMSSRVRAAPAPALHAESSVSPRMRGSLSRSLDQ